ncbi:YhfT family protein [Brachyspira aalborgi]|uniref:YhfT family protein n=1 Tax=Brachyspira aalborgi TaxID=29522 RepID=UPI002666F24D|nr:YhfT family protein [Brachyspira aalborgi]
MKYIVSILVSSLASLLANRGVAVFNDGLRPIFPEYLEGRLDRKSLFATSFALSFGLVIGYGIPFSLTSSIILIHSILLGTDIIGVMFKPDKKGAVFAIIFGGIYGLLITLGLNNVISLFEKLPVNFLPSLSKVGSPIVTAFAVFPALVIGYQYSFKKGILSFFIIVLVRQVIQIYGKFSINNSNVILNPDGMALLIGMSIMLVFAIKDKRYSENVNSNQMLLNIFSERIKRIKKNMLILALMGGLIASAVSLGLIAGDPISLNLLSEKKISEAGFIALARTLGFIPLIATTAIATGVYAPTGMTFVFVLGIFIKNPFISFVAGFIIIILEIMALESIAKLFDRFPGIRACGDQVRTCMSKVLELALIGGSLLAAGEMASGIGYIFVIGLYTLNKTSKKPFMDIAMGPIAAIILGILINILYVLKLYLV